MIGIRVNIVPLKRECGSKKCSELELFRPPEREYGSNSKGLCSPDEQAHGVCNRSVATKKHSSSLAEKPHQS